MPAIDPTKEGVIVWPGALGATNWFSPSYNPEPELFYVSVWESPGLYVKGDGDYEAGQSFLGGRSRSTLEENPGRGAIRALNARTGEKGWDLELVAKPMNGVMSTACKLVFTGSASGHFYALDAETITGDELDMLCGNEPSSSIMSNFQMMSPSCGLVYFSS